MAVLPLVLAIASLAQAAGAAASAEEGILEPRPGATLGMTVPITLVAAIPRAAGSTAAYRWSLRRVDGGRLVRIPQASGPAGDGFSISNRFLHVAQGELEGARPGPYELTLEIRFAPAIAGGGAALRIQHIPIALAAEILTTTAVSPGRLSPGDDRGILYGRGLGGARVELAGPIPEEDSANGVDTSIERSRVTVPALADRDGSSLRFGIPTFCPPGLYRVRARRGRLRSRSQWIRVEPDRIAFPQRPDRRGIARPLRSGQTVRDRFDPRGDAPGGLWDFHVYYFVAGARSVINVRLERVDKSRSWQHPEELDPELYVVAPDEIVYGHLVGRDVAPGSDLNAAIKETPLPRSGLYFLVAGTTKGSGEYDLFFSLAPAALSAESDQSTLLTGSFNLVRSGALARSVFLLLDPRGYPVSGAPVSFVPTPEATGLSTEFPQGASGRTGVDGLVAATLRFEKPGFLGIASALYRPRLQDRRLVCTGSQTALSPSVPRVPLAGAVNVLVREVDLVSGDILLSKFEFDKL